MIIPNPLRICDELNENYRIIIYLKIHLYVIYNILSIFIIDLLWKILLISNECKRISVQRSFISLDRLFLNCKNLHHHIYAGLCF